MFSMNYHVFISENPRKLSMYLSIGHLNSFSSTKPETSRVNRYSGRAPHPYNCTVNVTSSDPRKSPVVTHWRPCDNDFPSSPLIAGTWLLPRSLSPFGISREMPDGDGGGGGGGC